MKDAEAFLAHYGRKGMKWGVVNDDDSFQKTKNAVQNYFKKKDSKELQVEGQQKKKAQLEKLSSESSKTKSVLKDNDSDPPISDVKTGRLSRNQKIALGVGVTVAVAGLAYYGNQKLAPGRELKKKNKLLDDEMLSLFGPNMNPRGPSNQKFFAGLANGKALDRPGFTIPKSVEFQRLAGYAEDGSKYNKGTYASFLSNDKERYSENFGYDLAPVAVKFNPKDDVRVPSTRTVLKTLKDLGGDDGSPLTDDQAIKKYTQFSGGDWQKPEYQKLINGLKKQGYSALVDDMDAGYTGDLPIVFFGEPSNLTASTRPKPPSEYERRAAPTSGRYA